ncbi:MAG: hypothetical protein KH431_02460 [Erysipelotrichaceae bacterium]|nr:hypothetical protein [Erysipelotrichaceae bacterium]
MEKLSRVKKYEDLRKNIESENPSSGDVVSGDKLSSYANKLNTIDPTVFKKMDIKEENHIPERERREAYFQDELDTPISSFTNEYLDDFISEVKEYNIRKGTRENEDTEIDILSQLQNVSRKRSQYVEQIKDPQPVQKLEETNTISRDDIAKQVQELLKEEKLEPVNDDPIVTKAAEPKESTQVYEKITRPQPVMEAAEVPTDSMHAQLVEETQQLRVQLNEYEGELTDLNDGLDKTNRILNIILCTLIFVLIAVIGVVIYWLVKEGGLL